MFTILRSDRITLDYNEFFQRKVVAHLSFANKQRILSIDAGRCKQYIYHLVMTNIAMENHHF